MNKSAYRFRAGIKESNSISSPVQSSTNRPDTEDKVVLKDRQEKLSH